MGKRKLYMEVEITSELSKDVAYDRNCLWQEEQ